MPQIFYFQNLRATGKLQKDKLHNIQLVFYLNKWYNNKKRMNEFIFTTWIETS